MARRERAVISAEASAQRRAAVLGSPIAHSLSPVLHRAAYRDLGLDWRYDAVEVTESELAAFVAGCGPEWAGLSLTMPLKRAVLPLLHTRAPLVDIVGAANTIVFESGRIAGHNTDVAGMVTAPVGSVGAGRAVVGARRIAGHNTDVVGMVTALREVGAVPGPAVVLGGGATAASALAALGELGCPQVRLLARRPEVAARQLSGVAERVGIGLVVGSWPQPGEVLPDVDLASVVVSTAPAAAGASLVDVVPRRPGALLDVSYDPWPPVLVAAWQRAGGPAVAGDEMLLHQAVAQVELMTGRTPSTEVMRAALRSAIVVTR